MSCLSSVLISGDIRSTKYLGFNSTSKYLTLVHVLPSFDCNFTIVLFPGESRQLLSDRVLDAHALSSRWFFSPSNRAPRRIFVHQTGFCVSHKKNSVSGKRASQRGLARETTLRLRERASPGLLKPPCIFSYNQGASKNNQLRVEPFLVGRDSRESRMCQEAQHKKSK